MLLRLRSGYMSSSTSIRRATQDTASRLEARLEARCREVVTATARRCIDWVLRELAANAVFYHVIDNVIEHLMHNPEVEELVRRQSATLVGQAVDELRTGAARADN